MQIRVLRTIVVVAVAVAVVVARVQTRPSASYGRWPAVRSGRTRTVCTSVPASYGVVSNHLSPVTSCDPVNLSREILSVYVFTPSTLVHPQSLLPSRILSIQRLGW